MLRNLIKITVLLFLMPLCLTAQKTTPSVKKENKPPSKITVLWSDLLQLQQAKGQNTQRLIGDVQLKQDSVFMYCDSATIEQEIRVFAKGNVIIQQNDTVSVFADSAYYDGALRIAELFGEVILVNGTQKLFTDRLTYNLGTKVATYNDGAVMTNGSTQLTSKGGAYFTETKEIYFQDSVTVVDPRFSLRSDTLKFNTETKMVFFLGPTLISNDSSRIYCESGFYDTQNNVAEFSENAQYLRKDQKATATRILYNGKKKEYVLDGEALFEDNHRKAAADMIRYNEINDQTFLKGNATYQDSLQNIASDEIFYDAKNKKYRTKGRSRISDPPNILEADDVSYDDSEGFGTAAGNVVWQDTSAQTTIVCALANYNRETGYLKASGGKGNRPLLITRIEDDSLYMAADTLLSLRADTLKGDSARLLLAYKDVRIFKSNLQAICDSLSYSNVDSIFRLFRAPIIWSDTSQFVADTIHIQLKAQKLDRIFLRDNAFIINSPDELFFNQIKGRFATATFKDDELRRMDVQGNAESVYYARDEAGGYVGVNKTVCSEMTLLFGNNKVDQIKFFTQPQARAIPMKQANHDEMKIPGFRWEKELRIKKVDDLFAERERRQFIAVPLAPAASARPDSGGYPESETQPKPPTPRKRSGGKE
ncbi:MAG: hypothetical protein HUU01_10225 [Saprospiraceae bacterium]|nr:hypothetical protein [Saprospiraceae bacterium]